MASFNPKLDKYEDKFLDTRLVFLMDVGVSFVVSLIISSAVYFFEFQPVGELAYFAVYCVTSVLSSCLMFYLLKTYRIIIRHFRFRDCAIYGLSVMGKMLALGIVVSLVFEVNPWYFLLVIFDAVVTLFALLMIRYTMISVYEVYKRNVRNLQKCARTLVYGTSEKTAAVVDRLANSDHFNVVGIISMGEMEGKVVFSDKTVYNIETHSGLSALVSNLSLTGIIYPTDGDAQKERNRLIEWCSDLGLKSYIVPSIDELSSSSVSSLLHVREVKIEDLLGREEIVISLDKIKDYFKGKVVMVTGAAGSIGSELCRQLAGFGISRLVMFDNAETPTHNVRLELEETFPGLNFVPVIGDVRQPMRLDFAFRTYKPQVVFHAAAYKHVPLMEENPCEAVLVNVAGTRNVADMCLKYGIEKMVMVSTDKAVNPTNIMGCSKRLAEIYVQSLGLAVEAGQVDGRTRFVTTRFGNVLGSNGSVIPRFREQIAKGGPVTVTHPDINRFFMTIPEACRLVMEAALLPTENHICVFDMGSPVKIDTLARRMIELSGLVPDKDVKIVYTGLRPGEKLYEEVLSSVENTEPTNHDRIRIAKVRVYDYREAQSAVDRLETLGREVNIPDMVRLMKQVVPEFISKNSRFQEYDVKQ